MYIVFKGSKKKNLEVVCSITRCVCKQNRHFKPSMACTELFCFLEGNRGDCWCSVTVQHTGNAGLIDHRAQTALC